MYTAVLPQLGVDPRDLDHARRFLADLASGKYDLKYHYFDVLAADCSGSSSAARSTRTARRSARSRAR